MIIQRENPASTNKNQNAPSFSLVLLITIRVTKQFQPQNSSHIQGRIGQSVTCLAVDAKLTANPGVVSSIPARSHAFVEIDHEIISMIILLPSAESFMKGCCQLQTKVCARITG